MKQKLVAGTAVIAVIALAGFVAWCSLNPRADLAGKPESLTIGLKHAEANALIYIAEDRGFFTQNGLNVTIMTFTTKLESFNGMVKGDVDLSVISEYPIVAATFDKENIRVVGSTCRFQDQYLVGRQDRGIKGVADLDGKKIGVPSGTIAEFYFGRFLNLHGISLQDVALEPVPFAQAADALFEGRVDAVMIYDGAPRSSETLSKDSLTVWPVQSSQASYDVIACRNDWIASHPGAIRRFLKSLYQAEEYLVNHPAEGRAIVEKTVGRTDAQMATIWPRFRFSLILDQSLILAMEDEARWMIKNNLTTEKTTPDFLEYIYVDGLEAIKPEAVNIIR